MWTRICFWSLWVPPSFCARRWAARAHWAVSRLVRFFMKIRDSFPLPISSSRWDRLLRKTAWTLGKGLGAVWVAVSFLQGSGGQNHSTSLR